jgi:prepilin-type N-terminal cleavage/methylation domain-containing protein
MQTTNFRRINSQIGFTLVEIMIVIAIIAGVLAVGVPKMFSSSTRMRAAIRKIAVMTRDIRNNSRLYGVTTRLVISLDKNKGYTYSVESSPGVVLMRTELQEEELAKLTDAQAEGEKKKTDFTPETRVLKRPISLPKGLIFEDVEKAGRSDAITEDKAYINFYPQGLSEESAIHLGNGKDLHWTIVINPLTGRADLYERHLTLKELKNL